MEVAAEGRSTRSEVPWPPRGPGRFRTDVAPAHTCPQHRAHAPGDGRAQGDTWASVKLWPGAAAFRRAPTSTTPARVKGDVAVVTVDLAGVSADVVSLEASGRGSWLRQASGARHAGARLPAGRDPHGTFRRAIELGIEVDADRAKATSRTAAASRAPGPPPRLTSTLALIESPAEVIEEFDLEGNGALADRDRFLHELDDVALKWASFPAGWCCCATWSPTSGTLTPSVGRRAPWS